jgi:phospholipid/cholesterol/gamma-HCH transport system permease protein
MQSNNSSLAQSARTASRLKLAGDMMAPTLQIAGTFDWRIASQERTLLEGLPPRLTAIDFTQMREIDTVGALIVLRLCNQIMPQPRLIGLSESQHQFLDEISHAALTPEPVVQPPSWRQHIAAIGDWAYDLAEESHSLIAFFGEMLMVMGQTVRHPRRLRVLSILHHIQEIGLKSLPIVGLLSLLLGIVLAFQGADQLKKFGASLYVVNLLGISVLRELGVIITAIIIAGRSGSAFAAQIGTMQANEEIDAMRTIGMDPVDFLVLPRVIALVVTLPLLVFFADCVSIIGGAAMADLSLGISFPQFVSQFHAAITPQQFWVGESKAPLFGLLIALVGCFQGLRVTGSAESVGRQTTAAVVQSIFMVIAVDAIFSVLFSFLHV